MRSDFSPYKGLILLLLLGLIWGTGYSIARYAMTNGVPPLGYSLWQSIGPALIVTLITLMSKRTLDIGYDNFSFYLLCGLTGIVIPNTTMYFAAPHLPASILAMVVNTVPIIAYPMALFANLERFDWQRFVGIGIAVLSLMLLIIPAASLPSPYMIPWVTISLITPISFAFCSVFIAKFSPKDSDPLTLTTGMLLFSSLLLIPIVFSTDNFYPLHYPLLIPDWIILLEIILSSIGYLLFFKLITVAGPVYYSLVDTIVVLTGLFWGYVIFGETLNQWTATSVFLIILALLLVTQKQRTAAIIKDDDSEPSQE